MMSVTDQLTLLQAGDESAWRVLFSEHYPVMCYIATEYLHDHGLAENMVSEVFTHFWEKRYQLNPTSSIRLYLLQATRNRCKDYLKSKYANSIVFLENQEIARMESIFKIIEEGPLPDIYEKELRKRVDQAIENLPDDCRRVFRKSRYEDKSYKEIADELGISVNTVKYHMKRALGLLHDSLGTALFIVLLLNI